MTIKLEVGKKYRNRKGEVITIKRFDCDGVRFVYQGDDFFFYDQEGICAFSALPRLIEEVIEEPLKKPLTLAEDLAKAAGILLAYGHGVLSNSLLTQANVIYESIKPPEVPQWRKDMAKALDDGKVVEVNAYAQGWTKTDTTKDVFLDPYWKLNEKDFRIKPEPKPDYVSFWRASRWSVYSKNSICGSEHNLKLIWDGETCELKDAEVIK